MRKFKVKSRSQKNVEYEVNVSNHGKIDCNCSAGQRNVACNHVILINKIINRIAVLPEEYDRIQEIK